MSVTVVPLYDSVVLKVGMVTNRVLPLIDQMVVSGGNFLFTLLVARYLEIADFGHFSLIWLAVLFANSLHMAALTMPMFTISATLDGTERRAYFATAMVHQHLFNFGILAVCLLGWGAARIFWAPALGDALLIAVVSAAFHTQEFYRRFMFCEDEPHIALLIDTVAYGFRFVPLVALKVFDSVTVPRVLLALTAGYGLSALIARLRVGRLQVPEPGTFGSHSREQWEAARYLLPSAVLQWTSVNLHLAVAGVVIGVRAVGVVRLGQALINAGNVFLQAIENVLPTRVARLQEDVGARDAFRYTAQLLLRGLGFIGLLSLLVALFASDLMAFVFGASYGRYGYVLYWLGPIYALSFAQVMVRVIVRTLGITRDWFRAYLLSSLISIAIFYPLQAGFRIHGVLAGIVIAYLVQVSIAARAVLREVAAR